MKQTTLARMILWIGIIIVGLSLWGKVLSPLQIFWYTLAGGLLLMIFSGIQITKEK